MTPADFAGQVMALGAAQLGAALWHPVWAAVTVLIGCWEILIVLIAAYAVLGLVLQAAGRLDRRLRYGAPAVPARAEPEVGDDVIGMLRDWQAHGVTGTGEVSDAEIGRMIEGYDWKQDGRG